MIKGNAAADKITGKINKIDFLYLDAYELAVVNGFEGTIEEWYASLTKDAVKHIPQTLTEEQKEQARLNIGAASVAFVDAEIQNLADDIQGLDEKLNSNNGIIFYNSNIGRLNIGTLYTIEYDPTSASQQPKAGDWLLSLDGCLCVVLGEPFLPENSDIQRITVRCRAVINSDGVLYSEQTLTDEQKAQARANIGAKDPYFVDIVLDGDPYVEGFVFDGDFDFDELVAAVKAGRYVALRWDWEGKGVFQLSHISEENKSAVFVRVLDGQYYWVWIDMKEPNPISWDMNRIVGDTQFEIELGYKENTANRVTTIDETADDEHYPSAKAVFQFVSDQIAGTDRLVEENETAIADLQENMGDIETALDSIIAIQNSLIGGDSV